MGIPVSPSLFEKEFLETSLLPRFSCLVTRKPILIEVGFFFLLSKTFAKNLEIMLITLYRLKITF